MREIQIDTGRKVAKEKNGERDSQGDTNNIWADRQVD